MTRLIDSMERYQHATKRMQSGVAMDLAQHMDERQTAEKHLRVGVNVALVDHAALVSLLVKKGLITEEEYWGELANYMEAEVRRYEALLTKNLGTTVHLGEAGFGADPE